VTPQPAPDHARPSRPTLHIQGYVPPEPFSRERLAELAGDILAERIARDEIVIELPDSARGPAGSLVLAPLWPAEPDAARGTWCLAFNEPNPDGRWCLAEGEGASETHRWYVWLGAEIQILDCCAVPLEPALSVAARCCSYGRRDEAVRWVDFEQAFVLD
jgi:hypothetical protein